MRLLLDECIPRKFKNALSSHECQTVPEAGLAGKKNGELLSLAEQTGFEVFVTLDRGIAYQQKLWSRKLAIVLIRARQAGSMICCLQRPRSLNHSGRFGWAPSPLSDPDDCYLALGCVWSYTLSRCFIESCV